MVYIAADEDLRREGSECLQYLSALEPDPTVQLSVQIDRPRSSLWDLLARQGGARRYVFQKPISLSAPQRFFLEMFGWTNSGCRAAEVHNLGETDSASPEVLADYLFWANQEGSQGYDFLVLFGHGDGFLGLLEDDTSGNRMTLGQLADALRRFKEKRGRKLDVLFLHACWMSQLEIVYELQDSVDYFVASQHHMKDFGFPVEQSVNWLQLHSEEPSSFSLRLVQEPSFRAEGVVGLSRVDMGELGVVLHTFKAFCGELLSCPKDVFHRAANTARERNKIVLKEAPYVHFVDLIFFVNSLLSSSEASAAELKEKASEFLRALRDCVQDGGEVENHFGLSIYLPEGPPVEDYLELSFVQESGWLEVLRHFSAKTREQACA